MDVGLPLDDRNDEGNGNDWLALPEIVYYEGECHVTWLHACTAYGVRLYMNDSSSRSDVDHTLQIVKFYSLPWKSGIDASVSRTQLHSWHLHDVAVKCGDRLCISCHVHDVQSWPLACRDYLVYSAGNSLVSVMSCMSKIICSLLSFKLRPIWIGANRTCMCGLINIGCIGHTIDTQPCQYPGY